MAETPSKNNLRVPLRSNSGTLTIDKKNCNELNDTSDQGTLDDISEPSFDDDISEYDEITKERRLSFKVGANTVFPRYININFFLFL